MVDSDSNAVSCYWLLTILNPYLDGAPRKKLEEIIAFSTVLQFYLYLVKYVCAIL